MKEFNLDDIVNELYDELGFKGSKVLLRKILRKHLNYIFKVMRSKRHRVLMDKCDITTIYTNPDLMELLGFVADLDEARMPDINKNGLTVTSAKFKNRKKEQKRAARRNTALVHYIPELKP